jgi:hypothetical protein
MSDDNYKSMMKFLSKELHVSVQAYNTYAQTKPWLSINPGDSQVTEDLGDDSDSQPLFCRLILFLTNLI